MEGSDHAVNEEPVKTILRKPVIPKEFGQILWYEPNR